MGRKEEIIVLCVQFIQIICSQGWIDQSVIHLNCSKEDVN